MYILKNAWTSIWRNKGRNILIMVIVIVIAASCAVTLAIMNSANKIVKAYDEKYEVKATIGTNRENLMETFKKNENKSPETMINEFANLEQVKISDIEKYGDSKYVKNYYYTYSMGMNANGISEATDQIQKRTTESGGESQQMSPPGGRGNSQQDKQMTQTIENIKAQNGAFTLIGYNSYKSMSDFINGNYTITSGSVSSDFSSNTCVISEELAQLNNLSVGQNITLVDPKNTALTYSIEITGIYKENTMEAKDMGSMFSSSVNNIITNFTVCQNITNADTNLKYTVNPTFILNDKDCADDFKEEVSSKGLNSNFEVTTNLEEVEQAAKGINNISNFALTFLLITLAIGAIVLFVINMINIRERKYEIGVLRTIGMSKSKLIFQFMIELLIVAVIGLGIGAAIGSVSSVPVANMLLENEILNSQSQMEQIDKNFGGGPANNKDGNDRMGGPGGQEPHAMPDGNNDKFDGMVEMKEIESMEAVVDFVVLAELLGIGIALTILSSLASCIAIARFSPLEILRERS